MENILLPIRLVVQKVPFLEFIVRMVLFVFNPLMPRRDLKESKLKFAIVDYVFSFTVVLIVLSLLIPTNPEHISYRDILKAFNFEWVIGSYVYYTGIQFSLFVASYWVFFKFRAKSDKPIIDAYYTGLQFLRWHSIVVFLSVFGAIHILSLHLNYAFVISFSNVGYYFKSLPYSHEISCVFLFLGFWLYIFPMSLFIYYKSMRKTLFGYFRGVILCITLYSLSFIANGLAPSEFVVKILNQNGYCEVLEKSVVKKRYPKAYKNSEWGEKCT
ncbi:TPA: hypothetical protein NJ542_004541 [Vibrio parahaemolyticus]|nr:hypothetical protein [Vibrio parahaemolyticus]